MMFSFVLIFHIVGAFAMGVVGVFLLISILQNDVLRTKYQTRSLAWALGFELTTGSLLAILSPEGASFLQFCQNVAVYVSISGALFLFATLRIKDAFPRAQVLVPVIPSLVLVTATATSLL